VYLSLSCTIDCVRVNPWLFTSLIVMLISWAGPMLPQTLVTSHCKVFSVTIAHVVLQCKGLVGASSHTVSIGRGLRCMEQGLRSTLLVLL
jgi:hypothetical protein